MRVNINKTEVMISGEWQKVMQKAVRWAYGVCGRGVDNNSILCYKIAQSVFLCPLSLKRLDIRW